MENLIPGKRLRLVDFKDTHEAYINRLSSLGLRQGTEVIIKHKAPLGCPIAIEFMGTTLVLRQEEFSHLTWETLA